ncbi:unnamed protein product, partial [Polarella glacialis]
MADGPGDSRQQEDGEGSAVANGVPPEQRSDSKTVSAALGLTLRWAASGQRTIVSSNHEDSKGSCPSAAALSESSSGPSGGDDFVAYPATLGAGLGTSALPLTAKAVNEPAEDWAWLAAWTAKWLQEQRERLMMEQQEEQHRKRTSSFESLAAEDEARRQRCNGRWTGAIQAWRVQIRSEARTKREQERQEARAEAKWQREAEQSDEDHAAAKEVAETKKASAECQVPPCPPPAAAPPPPPQAPPPPPQPPASKASVAGGFLSPSAARRALSPTSAWPPLFEELPAAALSEEPLQSLSEEPLQRRVDSCVFSSAPSTPRKGGGGVSSASASRQPTLERQASECPSLALDVAECSGLIGLAARLVSYAADTEVWNEARRHAVKQILEGRTQISEVKDLPFNMVLKLLKPKGYEVPGPRLQILGSGSFGRVLKVRRSSDGKLFAVKRQFLGDAANDVVPVLRETSILNVLKGACNVVQIEDAFLVSPASCAAEVWTVLEFFPHNLHRVSHRFRTEEPCRRAVFQVLLGLHSLHSADIIHRDLKPENLLVDLGPRPPWTVRVVLCDFGMSRSVHGFSDAVRDDLPMTPLTRKMSDRVTSCWWRAPEMWGWADTKMMMKRDLKSLDVFAFGLVWAGLLTRRSVITHEEGVDPPKFRLLEILRKVDRPKDSELAELGFSEDVAVFVCNVLDDSDESLEAVRAEMVSDEWPEKQAQREALLHEPYSGIREWVRSHTQASQEIGNSRALSLIEDAARPG